MAVFRIEKTRDYTVMSNHHLKDRTLTLKSKGLLSMMLSLPDEWNYTTRGLSAICREGVDSIGAALKELETHGYIRRTQLRDEKGKITDTEYVIYEMPQCEPPSSPGTPLPGTAKPYTENPDMGVPDTAEPCTENPAQLNQGYVRDTGDSFHEYYDGERGSIPDEYRVMTFQDDLPEEEKSEWAMDIAFDMDEFFRQNDPQYAAEHPEAHAAKEELYESLMAGRISALDEKLAALGQTQEDYLPSEIEKFKDATGYEEFLDFDPAEIKAALENPDKSRIDEMLAFAEKAEREYAAEIAAYVQTPADIAEQVQAVPRDTFSIYQLKPGDATRDYRFEPLDAIRNNGLSVKPENYELVYTAPLTEQESLESIYTRFNIDHPADFKGHSLSVSDIVVLHQDGKDTAHYCDRFGFSQVPEFLQPERAAEVTIPTPDQMATQERISTPRGSFCVTNMTREQMEAAGYGVHHISDDGKYLIMGNGTRAFAVAAEQPEKDNPLRTVEMTLEDDYGMIDGIINNGRRGEELEKAQKYAERITPEKPSIRERLEDAKRECAEHKPPEGKKPGRDVPEHDCL